MSQEHIPDQRSSLADIRARASEPVTEIVANPQEYYRVQKLLRDRADLLSYVEELQARIEKLKAIIEDYVQHQLHACADIAAVESGWCYCGLEHAMKEAGL